jgi:hypothetical protein
MMTAKFITLTDRGAWHHVNSSALEKLLKAPELAAERLMLGAGNVVAA